MKVSWRYICEHGREEFQIYSKHLSYGESLLGLKTDSIWNQEGIIKITGPNIRLDSWMMSSVDGAFCFIIDKQRFAVLILVYRFKFSYCQSAPVHSSKVPNTPSTIWTYCAYKKIKAGSLCFITVSISLKTLKTYWSLLQMILKGEFQGV